MVDQVFRRQIVQNIEIYVDNIVIKIQLMTGFAEDLKETLGTLRRVGLKLYPSKCICGLKSGKFLRHIVSHIELRANLEETSIFVDIRSLKSIKKS